MTHREKVLNMLRRALSEAEGKAYTRGVVLHQLAVPAMLAAVKEIEDAQQKQKLDRERGVHSIHDEATSDV